MAVFTHSVLRSNALIAADGDQTFDLPVNPLSVILLHISPLNETTTIGNYSLVQGLLSAINNIRVTHKGSAVVDLSGADLAVLVMLYHKLSIWQNNAVETDGFRRSIILPIMFGRRAYMPNEAMPETKKGELQLTLTFDIADTGFDGLRLSIETIELPDAAPEFVQKVTTLAQTFAATGQNEIDMPIGHALRGVLLFGTTGFSSAAPGPTLGELQFLVENRQVMYSATDFEVLRGALALRGVPFPVDFRHIHSLNAAGAGREDTLEPEIGNTLVDNYALLDFDPLGDDTYVVDTAGKSRVHIRVDAEQANAVRAMPIERVPANVFTQ